MSIEELVEKYERLIPAGAYTLAEGIRAALTELAAKYEQRLNELDGVKITVGDGLVVYGSVEAIRRVQAYILLDSMHPAEARDTNRYFAKQLQAAEQRIRQLEAERVPEGWKLVPTRCPLCEYQHGHKIGCENNPVDIAMLSAAPAKEDSRHD